jgi:serine protease Do
MYKHHFFNILSNKIGICLYALSVSIFSSTGTAASPAPSNAPLNAYWDFTGIAKKATPAVVSISVKGSSKQSSYYSNDQQSDPFDFFSDDFLQRFFDKSRRGQVQQPIVTGQASGFIVDPEGYILTNGHVVQDMSEITVVFNDGKEYPARVIGSDADTDIALIKIEAKNLPFLKFADIEQVEVGQWVAAIGNPLGLQASLTSGVVSAKGRNNLDLTRIQDYIQTDAAINRGNSGGPLLNMNAEVIGMNTAIVTSMATGGYMGIGFAIPSNFLKTVMEELKSTGSFKRGFLGIALQQIDEDLAQAFGLKSKHGALIAEVTKDSPAEKAGLKQGDIIVKFNNNPITNIGSLRNAIALIKSGTKISLSILRQGRPMDVEVIVGTFSQSKPIVALVKENKLGIEVENLNPEQRDKLGYPNEKGVLISKVDPEGPAAWAGLKKGALIIEVNQKKISTVDEFNEALQATPANKPVLFLIKQGEATRFVSIKIG